MIDIASKFTMQQWSVILIPMVYLLAFGHHYINFLQGKQFGQYIREDGPQSHQKKSGTPTMGGIMMFDALALTILVYAIVSNIVQQPILNDRLWLVLLVFVAYGLLGFVDDYLKVAKKHNKGVTGYTKLAVQFGIGALAGLYLYKNYNLHSIDILGFTSIDLGLFYPLFAALVLTATSNSTNLTDGLDGLASSCLFFSFIGTGILLFGLGLTNLSVTAFLFASACLGFLYYNRNPAQVFMGDTGSLALGGALGAFALVGGFEFWLLLLGFIYVTETLSVILQVISFKTTGKRIFKMSPIHHHFELCGLSEKKVVTFFAGTQLLMTILAVILYNK